MKTQGLIAPSSKSEPNEVQHNLIGQAAETRTAHGHSKPSVAVVTEDSKVDHSADNLAHSDFSNQPEAKADRKPAGAKSKARRKAPKKGTVEAEVPLSKARARMSTAQKPTAKTAPAKKKNASPPRMRKPSKPDDLKMISGVGPKIEGILNGLGVYKFDQVAKWKKAERDWVDGYLKFKGRIIRDDRVSQAKAFSEE